MSKKEGSQSFLKALSIQVASGGSAGFIEVCIMQPLDVVKTRLQLQRSPQGQLLSSTAASNSDFYKGVYDCFTKMYKYEGLSSFWKGILPPIMVETPKRALKFVSFEQYKNILMFGAATPTPIVSLGAGVTEAILANPFEVVKVTQQADRSYMKEALPTWVVTKTIIREKGFGLRGLNKGLTATMGRNGVFNMIYFGFYHSSKNLTKTCNDKRLEFARKAFLGFVSGTLASIANIPFDVAKSRIQGPQPIPNQIKYKKTFESIVLIRKEEGFRALYKGLLPKVMRLGPGGAIMLLVFEHVSEYLENVFK